jgi:hypothetical protein
LVCLQDLELSLRFYWNFYNKNHYRKIEIHLK